MKKSPIIIGLIVAALMLPINSISQKPKKTFDHEKFGKKVVMSMADIYIANVCPDDKALAYISEKTGTAIEQLEEKRTADIETLKEDIKFLDENGILRILDNVEVSNIRESPIKTADIILHCHYKDFSYKLILTNCIQTNISWYVGDRINPEGEQIQDLVDRHQKKKEAAESGFISKLQEIDDKQNAKLEAGKNLRKESPISRGHHGSVPYINEANFNLPIKGYYITNEGEKINAIIAYQKPEKLILNDFKLITCKEESSSLFNELDAQSDPNFKEFVDKNMLKAFSIGDQVFVKGGTKWFILKSEGAIRRLVNVVKVNETYVFADFVQKLNQEPIGSIGLKMNFALEMPKMVIENPEMSNKISAKQEGYLFTDINTLIDGYNSWYDNSQEGENHYLFPYDYTIPCESKADLGYYFLQALKRKDYNYLLGIIIYNSFYAQAIENNTPDPEVKAALLGDIDSKTERKIHTWNKKRFKLLLNEFDWSKIDSVDFVFEKNERKSATYGFPYGTGTFSFTINGGKYQLSAGKIFKAEKTWKISDLGEMVTTESGAVEEVGIYVPEQFAYLPDSWIFKAAFEGSTEVTDQYENGFINGKPINMYLMNDGTVMYQKGYRDRNGISYAQWSYVKPEDRDENEPEIDFTIKIWNTDGSSVLEKYALVKVTENELIYENKKLNMSFEFTRETSGE